MSGRSTLAASLTLAGGLAAGVGSFLVWAEISAGPIREHATGISGWEGKATLVAGIVMAIAAVRVFTAGDRAVARLRGSAFLGGLGAMGVGLYTALTAEDQLLDAAAVELPRTVVQDALDSGLLQLSLQVGLYVVIVGGLLGVIGGLATVGLREVAPASAGDGLTGWAAPPPIPSPPPTDPDPWAGPSGPGPPGPGSPS